MQDFLKEKKEFSRKVREEYDAVQRELWKLDAPYNDTTDSYIVTAKRFTPEARILARKYKRLGRILDMLNELDELYTQG